VLTKAICVRCINVHSSNPWNSLSEHGGQLDDDNWERGKVVCPDRFAHDGDRAQMVRIVDRPHPGCPYEAEHLVNWGLPTDHAE